MNRLSTKYENKVIVVAGGASGMGEQIVRQAHKASQVTIVLDHNASAGKKLASELGDQVIFTELEMTDTTAVRQVLTEIDNSYDGIDYFFNCAGSFMAGEIRDTPIEDWNNIFANNIEPVANATTAIYELMQKNKHGSIITLASSAGLFPVPVMNIYGATKSAVVSLMLGLRMEAKSFGVNVSVVCPTIVDTPLYDRATYAGVDKKKALDYLRKKSNVQQPDRAARQILKKAAKNRAIIHTSFSTYFAWSAYRISPTLYMYFVRKIFTSYRRSLRKPL